MAKHRFFFFFPFSHYPLSNQRALNLPCHYPPQQQDTTALQRMFDYITAPINFVTEYFLFNWEENPDWIPHRKFVPAVQKKYRIIDIQKIHPFDLLQIRIKQGRFEEAINLASQYDLPTDSIYQVRLQLLLSSQPIVSSSQFGNYNDTPPFLDPMGVSSGVRGFHCQFLGQDL